MKTDVETHEFPQRVEKRRARSDSLGEADGVRPSVARVIPFGSGATIKRQKVPTRRRSFRSPPLSSTLLQQCARSIEPQKRSAEARARCRFCATRTMARAAQLRSDVLTVFPNTLLRFYGEGARDRGPSLTGYD